MIGDKKIVRGRSAEIVIGVDPGLDGAIATLNSSQVAVHVMPTLKAPRGRGRVIDTQRIVEIFEMAVAIPLEQPHVFIEDQRPMPRQGVKSMFSLGKGIGVVEGVCAALRLPFEFVGARQWQKVMFAGIAHRDTKAAAILKAKQLYPNVSLLATDRCRKAHDGLADALLIATYGRRVLAGEGTTPSPRGRSG